MAYRELPAPGPLRALAECMWINDEPSRTRVLPDGCMDLIEMDDVVVVAGPDTTAFISESTEATGVRFHPGALPRLLGIPAADLRNTRVELDARRSLKEVTKSLLQRETTRETAPWRFATLRHVTARLEDGASVQSVADEIGWSARNLQRQCAAVYGYGPATLRRILRFRRVIKLIGDGVSSANAAVIAGYADQAHLSRDTKELAGINPSQLGSVAKMSTSVPSGSTTVA